MNQPGADEPDPDAPDQDGRGPDGPAATGPDAGEAERKMRFLFVLRSQGVTDARVLQAMEKIDRGAFVKAVFRAWHDAYGDPECACG